MIKSFLTAILVASFIFSPLAFADETTDASVDLALPALVIPPRLKLKLPKLDISILRSGQTLTATSDTVLMSPETLALIGIEVESINARHSLYLEQQLKIYDVNARLRISLLQTQNDYLEGELQRTNEVIIQHQELISSDKSGWYVAIGFGIGVLTAVGLAYAIAPSMKQ
jgi:hypothetical protein